MNAPAMRELETYLTNRARQADGTAEVYREDDGSYTLERAGHEPAKIGERFGQARKAILVLGGSQQRPST